MDNLQWQIGDVRITRVVEMITPVPPEGLIPTLTPEEVERNAAWLKPHFMDDDGNFVLSIHAFCVESQGRKIVVDTCIGNNRVIPAFGDLTLDTPFLDDLAAAGFAREDVDTVICTHLHFDHVGWNTRLVDGKWVPTFPNARYLFGRREYEHWKMLKDTHGYHDLNHMYDAVQPVVDAGLVDLIEPSHSICPEIKLRPTPGHTPGHVSIGIESRGKRALVTGDMMHNPIQLERPEDTARFDMDQAKARRTRVELIDDLANTDVFVIGSHFSDPTGGWIVRDEKGCRLAQQPARKK